jgi:hypothetical protein
MGIEFARSYKASDGKCYATLREAQEVELVELLRQHLEKESNDELMVISETILDNADLIQNILTTTDSSRPKARKVNGGSKPRKKAPATSAYSDIARLEEVASQVQTEAQRVLEAK